MEGLRGRRQVILDNIRDNDESGVNYHKVIPSLVCLCSNLPNHNLCWH